MKQIAKIKRILFVLFILFLASCATVPITGRRQLSLVNESEMIALSLTQYDQFMKENKLSTNTKDAEMVKRVGLRIAKAVEAYFTSQGQAAYLDGYKWEFNLVESKDINAWCMSGGKVVVYTGILPITKTEAGLAAVMGHEIAHAVARHGSERMSEQMVAQGAGTALSVALTNKPEQTQQLAMAAFGIGAQYGVLLPFARKHEYEADHMGLIFMAMAGYDPNESVPFWERMAQLGGSGMPEFLSTHPVSENRIAFLKEKMAEALQYYNPKK